MYRCLFLAEGATIKFNIASQTVKSIKNLFNNTNSVQNRISEFISIVEIKIKYKNINDKILINKFIMKNYKIFIIIAIIINIIINIIIF